MTGIHETLTLVAIGTSTASTTLLAVSAWAYRRAQKALLAAQADATYFKRLWQDAEAEITRLDAEATSSLEFVERQLKTLQKVKSLVPQDDHEPPYSTRFDSLN